jgi:hypothetical protein
MRDQTGTDAATTTNVMARGHAQGMAGAKELQDHRKTPTITMMKVRATHPILATQMTDSQTITAMETGHAHHGAIVKGHLAEKQMIQNILSSNYSHIFFMTVNQ